MFWIFFTLLHFKIHFFFYFNKFETVIYSCDVKADFFNLSLLQSSVLRDTCSIRNIYYSLLSMLKSIVSLNVYVETVIYFSGLFNQLKIQKNNTYLK